MIRKAAWALAWLVAAGYSANACSTCMAHALGAALQGIGAQTLEKHQLMASIGFMAFSESNAADEPGTRETEDTTHTTLDLLYGLSPRAMLGLSLPYVHKRRTATAGVAETSNGIGDLTLSLTTQTRPSIEAAYLWAFRFDLKLPTGENSQRSADGTLKEQPSNPAAVARTQR